MDPPYRRQLTGFLSRSNADRRPLSPVPSSTFSSVSQSEDGHGELGLTTLYQPPPDSVTVADVIFIHGLGGGSRKTWSYSSDPSDYWPQSWLPLDRDFAGVRIHAFGYNADWTEWQRGVLNIHDFAQSLLGELKNNPSIRRDRTLITLVGHSMGGCVAKKAYILAQQDPTCRDLVERMHSIFFLGTPHRGSSLASILENMLTLAWGKKPYVSDLIPGSATLSEINDSFRHYAQNLRMWSFYETQPVASKPLNKIVVEKLSATLGYPGEEIAAMHADHRHLCKFRSRDDPNYRLLRNALHSAIDMIRACRDEKAAQTQPSEASQQAHLERSLTSLELDSRVLAFLGISNTVEDNLELLHILKEPGSCHWFTESPAYTGWSQGAGPQMLWLTGRPAAGKSILSSHVIDHLKSSSEPLTSYFFFKHGKNGNSTLSECFLSLAYQMTMKDEFLRTGGILRLLEDQTAWDRTDEATVWRRLFIGTIFKSPLISQHCWVIDGVDECANFNALFTKKLLATVPGKLRIFATSRDLEEIGRGISKLGPRVSTYTMSEDDTLDDMRLFLSAKLKELGRLETNEDQEAMCNKILQKSRGSFLWVRLVLQEFENAWTEEDMEDVLKNVPDDLHDVYDRILQSIEADPRKKKLAKSILTWVILASRPLSIDELRCAIKMDINQTLQNLVKAVPSLCGQLVFVDQSNKIQIIHETARQVLLGQGLESDMAIAKTGAHTRLSSLLLGYLSNDVLKPRQTKMAHTVRRRGYAGSNSTMMASSDLALVPYATRFFSDHVCRSTSEDDSLMEELCSFLGSNQILSWIEQSARGGDLGDITRTAMNLRAYSRRRTKYVSPTDPQVHLIQSWVVDLIRVAAKFRSQLLTCPSSIHCLIPPLCPSDSVISRSFSKDARLSPLVVKNFPVSSWDDCLICIDYREGQTTAVAHGDNFFATGVSTGMVSLYDSVSMQRVRVMYHPERPRILEFGPHDQSLVSCGTRQLIVWNPQTEEALISVSLRSAPLSVMFLEPDELVVACQAGELIRWHVSHFPPENTCGQGTDYVD